MTRTFIISSRVWLVPGWLALYALIGGCSSEGGFSGSTAVKPPAPTLPATAAPAPESPASDAEGKTPPPAAPTPAPVAAAEQAPAPAPVPPPVEVQPPAAPAAPAPAPVTAPSAGTTAAATPAPVPPPVAVSLQFVHLPDSADNTNCISVEVNGGTAVKIGCNHGLDSGTTTTTVQAIPPPYANIVRLILTSTTTGGQTSTVSTQTVLTTPPNICLGPSTDTPANCLTPSSCSTHIQGLFGFEVVPLSASEVHVLANDNADNDETPNFNFTINASGTVNFSVENATAQNPCPANL